MPFSESVLIAIKGLTVHKVRTLLSTLGIIFGIASVVAMLSIGEGARHEVKSQIEAMGVNNIRIQENKTDQETRKIYRIHSEGLTLKDVKIIQDIIPGIYACAPMIIRQENIVLSNKTFSGIIVGTTQAFAKVSSIKLSQGRFLNPIDSEKCKRVCVIGSKLAQAFFPFSSPIGNQIQIHYEYYTIVGIAAPKHAKKAKQKFFDIASLNKRVYIPITCAMHRLTKPKIYSEIDEITIRTNSTDELPFVASSIEKLLNISHNKQKDFQVVVALDLMLQSQKSQRIFDIIMGSIAGISLLVGGIGIMNIMLANVSERRREIGIRRAVGARKQDILVQFLLEALFVCLFGGILGIFLGIGLAAVITYFFNWQTMISTWGIVLSLTVSLMDGVIFGTYPAWKGAKMDPIQALSTE